MTSDPVAMAPGTSVRQAAQAMREKDIGAVLIVDNDQLQGIVTDRDLVVRALAERTDLSDCSLRDVCSGELITAAPDEDANTAIKRMRDHAVRRIPVVDGGRPVGVLSLGDAAVTKDSGSVLADVSTAPGNP
ncbi:CBS domain-containing protein [Nocardia sp. BMG111209]|uniref:CBS domain-containing protein n=1 Tax=Nocardia sp. BMG111209 TaxID=1160137 RepID=UPI00037A6EA0|nr:CBS domain-containing protein [Nocardia sp. BMG111209]